MGIFNAIYMQNRHHTSIIEIVSQKNQPVSIKSIAIKKKIQIYYYFFYGFIFIACLFAECSIYAFQFDGPHYSLVTNISFASIHISHTFRNTRHSTLITYIVTSRMHKIKTISIGHCGTDHKRANGVYLPHKSHMLFHSISNKINLKKVAHQKKKKTT